MFLFIKEEKRHKYEQIKQNCMGDITSVNLTELAQFLVRAKQSTYAKGEGVVPTDRLRNPGFTELEYPAQGSGVEERFYYRDHYAGSLAAPGHEIVYVGDENGAPLWMMSYSGGMNPEFDHLTGDAFTFLKKVLQQVPPDAPFRGPVYVHEGAWTYMFKIKSKGDITGFSGDEEILYEKNHTQHTVFSQRISGGLVIGKTRPEITR